jgi:hypothetical protein
MPLVGMELKSVMPKISCNFYMPASAVPVSLAITSDNEGVCAASFERALLALKGKGVRGQTPVRCSRRLLDPKGKRRVLTNGLGKLLLCRHAPCFPHFHVRSPR